MAESSEPSFPSTKLDDEEDLECIRVVPDEHCSKESFCDANVKSQSTMLPEESVCYEECCQSRRRREISVDKGQGNTQIKERKEHISQTVKVCQEDLRHEPSKEATGDAGYEHEVSNHRLKKKDHKRFITKQRDDHFKDFTAFYEKHSDYCVTVLNIPTRKFLANHLNMGNEGTSKRGYEKTWRGLAECMQMDAVEILALETTHRSDPTGELMNRWERDQHSSIGKLIEYLEVLDRYDILHDVTFKKLIEESIDQHKNRQLDVEDKDESPRASAYIPITLGDTEDIKEKFDAFVCFDDVDLEFVKEMMDELEEKKNLKLCISPRDILPGLSVEVAKAKIITNRCDKTIIVLSPTFVRPDNERSHFAALIAISLSPVNLQNKVVPVLAEKCQIPEYLCHLTILNFTRPKGRDTQWCRLCECFRWKPKALEASSETGQDSSSVQEEYGSSVPAQGDSVRVAIASSAASSNSSNKSDIVKIQICPNKSHSNSTKSKLMSSRSSDKAQIKIYPNDSSFYCTSECVKIKVCPNDSHSDSAKSKVRSCSSSDKAQIQICPDDSSFSITSESVQIQVSPKDFKSKDMQSSRFSNTSHKTQVRISPACSSSYSTSKIVQIKVCPDDWYSDSANSKVISSMSDTTQTSICQKESSYNLVKSELTTSNSCSTTDEVQIQICPNCSSSPITDSRSGAKASCSGAFLRGFGSSRDSEYVTAKIQSIQESKEKIVDGDRIKERITMSFFHKNKMLHSKTSSHSCDKSTGNSACRDVGSTKDSDCLSKQTGQNPKVKRTNVYKSSDHGLMKLFSALIRHPFQERNLVSTLASGTTSLSCDSVAGLGGIDSNKPALNKDDIFTSIDHCAKGKREIDVQTQTAKASNYEGEFGASSSGAFPIETGMVDNQKKCLVYLSTSPDDSTISTVKTAPVSKSSEYNVRGSVEDLYTSEEIFV